jgi:antitoxin (DNA-binding transcriptional repressor) of toxin-antitoxin stability system
MRGLDCPQKTVILTDMKTITVRALARDPAFGRRANAGESFLVTHRGRPFFRILPPERPISHVGAGRHLAKGKAVSPDPIPASEWASLSG